MNFYPDYVQTHFRNTILLNARGDCNQIFDPEGKALDIGESLKYVKHSPIGYSWGYTGSEGYHAAFAILYDYTGNPILSRQLYQKFKEQFIAGAKDGGIIETRDIEVFLRENM